MIIKPKPDDPGRETAPATGNEIPHPGTGGSRTKAMGSEIINVSADAAPPLRIPRHGYRDGTGKYASRALPHREPTLVRETVTGRMMPGPSNAVLARENDGLAEERLHRVAPDYSGGRAISAALSNGAYSRGLSAAFDYAASDDSVRSNAGLMPAANLLNHIVSCPCLTTGGACCG